MKVSIHFALAPGKASDLPIRMRISYDGIRLDIRTGFVCPQDKWEGERMKTNTANRYGQTASFINGELAKYESIIRNLLTRYEIENKVPEADTLKSDFNRSIGKKTRKKDKSSTFIECFKTYMNEYGKEATWSSASYKVNITVLNRLEDTSLANILPDEITSEDLSDYINDLWDEGLENQTVSIYLTTIKQSLRWMHKNGIYHGNIYEDFTPKFKGLGKKDVHYLEWNEFKALLETETHSKKQAESRDAFCFSCATGLRISDCSKLKWSDVHLDAKNPYISIIAKKTTKPTFIELNKYSRQIIDAHLHEGIKPQDTVFVQMDMHTRIDTIKDLARQANITAPIRKLSFTGNKCTATYVPKCEAISTHWGRHTFIVHALRLGIPADVIMSWTGHSSYSAMKPYIAIVNEAKVENMAKFDTF